MFMHKLKNPILLEPNPADLIPPSVLREFFHTPFSDSEIRLMQTKTSELEERIQAAPSITKHYEARAWLAIAYSHPDLTNDGLLHILKKIIPHNTKKQLVIASAFGRAYLVNELLMSTDALHLIRENKYNVFLVAAFHGHLPVMDCFIKTLTQLAPSEMQYMLSYDKHDAFSQAAWDGNLSVMEYLIHQTRDLLSKQSAVYMITRGPFSAFYDAAQTGQIPVMQCIIRHLEALAPQLIPIMLQESTYYAFRQAAWNGHLQVVKFIFRSAEKRLPDKTLTMLEAWDYGAFREAVIRNDLSMATYLLQQLKKLAPHQIQKMIEAADEHLKYQKPEMRALLDSYQNETAYTVKNNFFQSDQQAEDTSERKGGRFEL
ncbi:MAG: hypothetical protein QNK11_02705 [Legionella sp.]|nr:hypothetical protein [Legionella sp.]